MLNKFTPTTYLYLHSLGIIHTLEETIHTLFLYAWLKLYSILYTLEGTYTPLLYTLGDSFRPVCGTPMMYAVHPIFNCVLLRKFFGFNHPFPKITYQITAVLQMSNRFLLQEIEKRTVFSNYREDFFLSNATFSHSGSLILP